VNISGENLTGEEYAAVFGKILGETVTYAPLDLDTVRALPVPGADDIANMFYFYAEHEGVFAGVRNPDAVREYNPRLQDFATWLTANRDKFTG